MNTINKPKKKMESWEIFLSTNKNKSKISQKTKVKIRKKMVLEDNLH